jgi:predicted metal-dependent hydrolase
VKLLKKNNHQDFLVVGTRTWSIRFFHNHLAKRYFLRVRPDGVLKVTIPKGGSHTTAMSFARRSVVWIEQQIQKQAFSVQRPKAWLIGSEILFRGSKFTLFEKLDVKGIVQFSDQLVTVVDINENLYNEIEQHLLDLAKKTLIPKTFELAAFNNIRVRSVTIRNQRTRWGSCSLKGSISLNWRLIQMPAFVSDYIILHELMHLREANHSPRFWTAVRQVCPRYSEAKKWLKQNAQYFQSR